jgi:uncharacterized Rossmann fold enzyme
MSFDVLLENPSRQHFAENIVRNARGVKVVRPKVARGKHLVICGAGPSLEENYPIAHAGDEVWACNGALNWLVEHDHRVTHGFTVEQKQGLAELWWEAPAVGYLLASSVHPDLVAQLERWGRPIKFFHNLLDLPEQDALYRRYWPSTVVAGAGLNAVTRAIDVATYMGFRQITIVGADCAMRDGAIHVGGGTPEQDECSPVTMEAEIDGRRWVAQPDLWISANWLVRMARASRGRIRLVGDTLPNALKDKPVEYLDRLPHTYDKATGQRIPIPY